MGLDTSHNAWHGPYSSFNDFRRWLGDRIGINLSEYIGYGVGGTKDLTSINHPLRPLFNHSDCDGELTPDECRQIAEGLKKVIDAVIPEADQYNYDKAIQFRDGCLLAHSKNEKIDFH